MEKQWHAVYTKLNCEKKVSALLTKKMIENYCPLNRQAKVLGSGKRMIVTPLFCSYVFVNVEEKEMELVKKTPHVIDFIYWLGMPASITDVEIREMKYFASNYFDLSIEKSIVDVHGVVKIIKEPSSTMQTNLLQSEGSAIKLFLPSLGVVIKTITSKAFNDESSLGLKPSKISL